MTDTDQKPSPALASKVALSWCLAWGDQQDPRFPLPVLEQMREAILKGGEIPSEVQEIVQLVDSLERLENFQGTLAELRTKYPELCAEKTGIGLVYGGATKIKGYVFDSNKLPEVRGASSLLDLINLVDLPSFFNRLHDGHYANDKRALGWLIEEYRGLANALCPELVVYSTGGNILALCPAFFIDDLCNAIEKRYTTETLTANSCAVGRSFRLLEYRLGCLQSEIEKTFWLPQFDAALKRKDSTSGRDRVIEYYGSTRKSFFERKSFNELVGVLASEYNRRRAGNTSKNRSDRRFPSIFDTHPYLQRDSAERRNAVAKVDYFDGSALSLSEPLARKRIVGQRTRTAEDFKWWDDSCFSNHWKPPEKLRTWAEKFEKFLSDPKNSEYAITYYGTGNRKDIKPAEDLKDVARGSSGFVGYIYADGNNMGGYIQKIRTQKSYRQFSNDVTKATTRAVYRALALHLHPVKNDGEHHHPFEILTIGGDDIFLIVPANHAAAIARTIGKEFEAFLLEVGGYLADKNSQPGAHRNGCSNEKEQCQLSMSSGVLIASESTPIYYAQKLVEQLLKSAKKYAKDLKKQDYLGGTVDFLSLKSVTMLAEKVETFRGQALRREENDHVLQLYAGPYTLHELGGLLDLIAAMQKVGFPRAQLYQIRAFLEQQGKRTSILNYRYSRVRMRKEYQQILKQFEETWCAAHTNNGNLAPWMTRGAIKTDKTIYETLWRDLVDLYDFASTTTTADAEETVGAGAEP
jgi:CRISPR-associated protein Cmr2